VKKKGMTPLDQALSETREPSFVPCHKQLRTSLQHPSSRSRRRTQRAGIRNDAARAHWAE
jgi:hypothetical protein